MRTYKETHSWLDFSLDLRKLKYTDWILLGEAASKCEHIAGVPLRPATAKSLHELYLAKGVLGTTAIEGNTLTEEQVLKILEKKLSLPPSKEYLAKEIDNIIEACNYIADHTLEKKSTDLTLEEIKHFNSLVLKDLEPTDENTVPGELRKHIVGAGRYKAVPADDCGHLLESLCEWLNNDIWRDERENEISFSILKAIAAHIYFELIHPFGDGNGRTGRLIEFKILLGAGVPTPAAHILSNHYNQTRMKYYKHLDYVSQSKGDLFPFITYALEGMVDGLREQVGRIQAEQHDITWRNYVHEKFREKKGTSDKRRRDMLLDLSLQKDAVNIKDISSMTPRMARAYADKTRMTVTRDINALFNMDLVVIDDRMVRPKKELILAFLPKRKK